MRATPQSFLRQPLSSVLAYPGNVRVLRELAQHGGELSATTLVDSTKLTRPSVLAALEQLAQQGYVEALGSSRLRLYRINHRHPLVPVLSALFAAEHERFHAVMDAIRAAADDAGVTAAWLYGSVARGEDGPDSDVDVVVVDASGNARSATAKVREALHEKQDTLRFSASVVGLDRADIVRLASENDPWWVDIAKDAVPLVGPDPVSLASRLSTKKRRSA